MFQFLRKAIIPILSLLFSVSELEAQKFYSGYNEWGILAGVSSYYGDISHGFDTKHLHPSTGITYKYNANGYFSFRANASYLKISGTDDGHPIYDQRNLSFQTPIVELGGNLEFNFRKFGTNMHDAKGTVYAFTGLNMFYFNPKRFENKDVNLRNARTQGDRYSRIQPSIPLGIGYKRLVRQRRFKGAWVIGVEANWRKTFTDRLDDANDVYLDYTDKINTYGQGSAQWGHPEILKGAGPYAAGTTRGDSHLKDWYYFVGISLSYRITPFICSRFN